jgi:mandelate racemase
MREKDQLRIAGHFGAFSRDNSSLGIRQREDAMECGCIRLGANKTRVPVACSLRHRSYVLRFVLKSRLPARGTDRAVVRAARSAAGEDLQVMVDYNQSLSVPEAIRRVQLLEEEALVWVEEPTRADDFAGHARIATECRTPIQIGENLWGPYDLTKSLSAGASDFVMLDVMKIGGITGWLRAASQAEAAGLPVSSHLFPELSAQLLAVCPQAHWLEYQDWTAPILQRPLELKDGFALPQTEAGSGLAWDKDAVEHYRLR